MSHLFVWTLRRRGRDKAHTHTHTWTHTHSQQMLKTHREMCLVILWLFCHEELQRGNKQDLNPNRNKSLLFIFFRLNETNVKCYFQRRRFKIIGGIPHFLVFHRMLHSHVRLSRGICSGTSRVLSVSLSQHLWLIPPTLHKSTGFPSCLCVPWFKKSLLFIVGFS